MNILQLIPSIQSGRVQRTVWSALLPVVRCLRASLERAFPHTLGCLCCVICSTQQSCTLPGRGAPTPRPYPVHPPVGGDVSHGLPPRSGFTGVHPYVSLGEHSQSCLQGLLAYTAVRARKPGQVLRGVQPVRGEWLAASLSNSIARARWGKRKVPSE